MANHVSHAALPYPIKGCRYTLLVPYLDADGDPTDPTTPDTERSIDGAAFADCTEEVTTITGSNGMGYITITGDEMNGSLIAVAAKVASGPKATLLMASPRVLPIIRSGTAQAGAAGTITLDSGASAIDDYYNGAIVRTTGGTGGGGGSGSLNNQARVITDYVGSTKVATIAPNWETTPSGTTTFEVLGTELWVMKLADVSAWLGTAVAALTSGGYVKGDILRINSAAVADELQAFLQTMIYGTVQTDAGNTASTFKTSITGEGDDAFNGSFIAFYGSSAGVLYETRRITDYVSATGFISVSPALSAAPANLDAFIILPFNQVEAGSLAANVITAAALAADAGNEIADAILSRPISNVEPTGAFRTLYGAICGLVNRVRLNSNNLEVYKTDDTTILATLTGTADAAQNPIKELDP